MLNRKYWMAAWLFLCLAFATSTVQAAPADSEIKLTGAAWSRTTDAVTGLIKLRLTLDASGPVEVSQFLTSLPNWRLVVSLGGINADRLKLPASPDSLVVTGASLVKSTRNITHLILDFPGAIAKDQYRISTAPADPRQKKPFQIILDFQKTVKPGELKYLPGLRGKIVVVDPGHGGTDPGAIGPWGTREKQLNLDLALQVKASLEQAGAKVLMTRTTDVDVFGPKATDREELWARVKVANFNQADVFISIHHNSSVNRDRNGTSTYYYQKTTYDMLLAGLIQETMLRAGGLGDMGVRPANFFVVKNTTMPAALLEVGFVSNPQEEKLLGNGAFQQKMAQAIVAGLDQFFLETAKTKGN